MNTSLNRFERSLVLVGSTLMPWTPVALQQLVADAVRRHPGTVVMSLLNGINHVALVTADLDRLADFYRTVFDADVRHLDDDAPFRHAILVVGDAAGVHAFELADNPNAAGRPEMFGRGHLDHLGLDAPSEEAFFETRRRLVEYGACDGSITDFGPMLSVWFEDPDGMGCEVCWIRDPSMRGAHGPQPYVVGVTGDALHESIS